MTITKDIDYKQKFARLRNSKTIRIEFISIPTPILADDDKVISPNRTNYFPFSQLVLATNVQRYLRERDVSCDIAFSDFKSLDDVSKWDQQLTAYGEVKYGTSLLTKYIVGDGMNRMKTELINKDVICITANFTCEANIVIQTIKSINRFSPHTLLIVGGRDASARAEYYLESGADIVAIGDSDIALPEFIFKLYKGEPLNERLYKDRILFSPETINLDDHPFVDFTFIKERRERYNESGSGGFTRSILQKGGIAYFETSRGCKRECDFCTERLSQRSEIALSTSFAAIQSYIDNNISTLMFADDNILQRIRGTNGDQELIEMFEFIRERRLSWEFPVGLELGKFMNLRDSKLRETLVRTMFWNNDSIDEFCGAFRALIPMENSLSKNEDIQRTYTKIRKLDDNLRILEAIMQQGIPQINLGVMIGLPDESRESIETTKDRINQINHLRESVNNTIIKDIKTVINYSIFCVTPLPGTPLFEQMRKDNRIKYDIDQDPELWNLYTSVIEGESFTPHDITAIRQEILNEFNSKHISGKVQLHLESGKESVTSALVT